MGGEGKLSALHAAWQLLLWEKLAIEWLVGSYFLVYGIKVLAKEEETSSMQSSSESVERAE